MTGFEPRNSVVRSDQSAKCATAIGNGRLVLMTVRLPSGDFLAVVGVDVTAVTGST